MKKMKSLALITVSINCLTWMASRLSQRMSAVMKEQPLWSLQGVIFFKPAAWRERPAPSVLK